MFENIIGNKKTLDYLMSSIDNNRIPHAQIFVGTEGIGLLQIAQSYAKYILCNTKNVENSDFLNCSNKVDQLSHPDIHYVFPVNSTENVKGHPVSMNFMEEWKDFIINHPYGSIQDWYNLIGIQNKQGLISVYEAQEIVKKLSLKAYEGGYKVMIIWMADKMNIATSNKILKILEEPPLKTVFILLTEKIDEIISTITSRCQIVEFHKPENSEIETFLIEKGITSNNAKRIAHQAQGDVNKALKLSHSEKNDQQFEEWFIKWVRSAFRAKGNAAAIHDLINWAEEVSSYSREIQKQFLNYCIEFFRQALLFNYSSPDLVYLDEGLEGFELKKFSPYINGENINEIYKEISDAIYHIERNGNGKIILTDLSIKLTRLIHKK